jgi:Protein ENHANCED DISEASE RESISTANCE 2, C-terminal
MTRFTEGGSEIRDRKVHMMIQMGQSQTLSFLGGMLVRFLSFLFSLTRKGRESPLGLEARRDRVPFPAIRLASYGTIHHFGGALRSSNNLPTNYVGMNTTFVPGAMPNLIARVLFTYLERQVSERVLDFTLVLEGESEDELPERALCTTRFVRIDTLAVAKDPAVYDFATQVMSARDAGDVTPSEPWPRRLASEFASAVQSSFITPKKGKSAPAINVATGDEHPIQRRLVQPERNAAFEDPMRAAIDEVLAILEGIKVPTKSHQSIGHLHDTGLPINMVMTPVVGTLALHEIRRFVISSDYNLQHAAVRIVKTAAWRGKTFPVDTRMCRIELQSGQVFLQGRDMAGNPVVYFRTMCRGQWRKRADATLAAALHRFEKAISVHRVMEKDVKCTLVLILGRPDKCLPDNATSSSETGSTLSRNIDDEDKSSVVDNIESTAIQLETSLGRLDDNTIDRPFSSRSITNPRVSDEEPWHHHCTSALLEQFVSLLFTHYPDRIAKLLLVKGAGQKCSLYRTNVAATRAMKRAIISPKERAKIRFLPKMSRLKALIDESELSAAALGNAPVPAYAFEC